MNTPVYRDKNVYITGGSSGIGLAAAKQFSSLGSHVIIFARSQQRLKTALGEIELSKFSSDQRFSFMSLDVSDHDAVHTTMSRAVEDFGRPDILINSAGIAYPNYFEKISYEKFAQTLHINLFGTWNTCACLVPHMKSVGGHIVNISSIAGFIGVFGYTAYSASKFAVTGFSQSLRSELKPYNLAVSVLCPPDTDTPQLAEENKTKPAETKAIAGNAGIMSPDAVAKALITGMKNRRFMIIPGIEGGFIYRAQRFFPGLVRSIMDIQIKRAGKIAAQK
jgi:3-dehydrosphinganine reductase